MSKLDYTKLLYEDTSWATRLELGKLHISTGEIVACDFMVQTQPAFVRKAPVGNFPISVFKDNKEGRVAFALIEFSPVKPTKWELALLPKDDPKKLKEGEFFGYPVDTGMSGFMDKEAAPLLEQSMLEAEKKDGFTSYYDDVVAEIMDENDCGVILPDSSRKENVVFFPTGWGDGLYPCYWGLDAEGNCVAIISEFFVYTAPEKLADEYVPSANVLENQKKYRKNPTGKDTADDYFMALMVDANLRDPRANELRLTEVTNHIQKYGKTSDLLQMQGNALADLSRNEEALAAFKEAVQLDPQSILARRELAGQYEKQKMFDLALNTYTEMTEQPEPMPSYGYIDIVEFYISQKNFVKAREVLDATEEEITLPYCQSTFKKLRATLYMEEQNYKAALQELDKALEIDSHVYGLDDLRDEILKLQKKAKKAT